MTVEVWQDCLVRYATSDNRSEALMAQMLLDLSTIQNPAVVWVFDKYATTILEATS
jgi:hypothetical protein